MFDGWRLLKCGYGKEWTKISWMDKISNRKVLAKVEEDRQIIKIIMQRQHDCIILRHQSLLLDNIEGQMKEEGGCRCYICWQRWLCGFRARS